MINIKKRGEDHSGKKYGLVSIINFSHKHQYASGKLGYFWNVKCDCGKEFKTRIYRLRTGKNRSCGCVAYSMRKKRMAPSGKILF